MDLFTHRTGGLEELEMHYYRFPPVSFDAFVENNPGLRSFVFHYDFAISMLSSQNVEEKAAQMVHSFVKAPNLSYLHLGNGLNEGSAVPDSLRNTLTRYGIEFFPGIRYSW